MGESRGPVPTNAALLARPPDSEHPHYLKLHPDCADIALVPATAIDAGRTPADAMDTTAVSKVAPLDPITPSPRP